MLQSSGETWVMLHEGIFRVEEHEVQKRGIGAGRRETILVVLLDHLQVLLSIVAAGSKGGVQRLMRARYGVAHRKVPNLNKALVSTVCQSIL